MIFVLISILLAPLFKRIAAPSPARIVVVQTAKIGDFVCTTPLIRTLKRAFPAARISLIANPAVLGLAAELPFIDEIIESPPDSTKGFRGKLEWIRKLRGKNFDMAFCCNGGIAWPGILALAGIPIRIGLTPNFLGKSSALAQRLWTAKAAHSGDQLIGTTYAEMLSLAGVGPYEAKKEVRAARGALEKVRALLDQQNHGESPLYIGLAISSANKLKELGLPLLTAICRGLLDKLPDATLIFLGTRADQDEATQISDFLPTTDRPRLINSCGLLSLAEIPGLIAELDVFVGVDSGLTYIAEAVETPLVSIAGPCNMRETRPTNTHAVIVQHPLPCCPCAHIFRAPYTCHLGTRACIKGITADEVVAEVFGLCQLTRGQKQNDGL